MPPPDAPVVFYVTGHGFGHARRAAAIIAALVQAEPALRVVVRTGAPAGIFAQLPRTTVEPPELPIDFGAAEIDPTQIDVPGTLRQVADLFARHDAIMAAEQIFLRRHRPRLVLADIPYLAGDAVDLYRRSVGGPVSLVAVGNFTWDYIYAPYLHRYPDYAWILPKIRAAYGRFDALVRLPFAHGTEVFSRIIDVPLVAQHPRHDRADTLARLGLDPADPRPHLLVAMRGGLPADLLDRAARQLPDTLLLWPYAEPAAGPPNLRRLPAGLLAGVDFSDLLAVAHGCVSKLGYGLVADAIAADCPLLYPPRQDMAEEGIFELQCPPYLRMRRLPREDFLSGRWGEHLRALLAQPASAWARSTHGAQTAAAVIGRWLA